MITFKVIFFYSDYPHQQIKINMPKRMLARFEKCQISLFVMVFENPIILMDDRWKGSHYTMAFSDSLKEKILKLGAKQKLGAIVKYTDNPNEDVRMTVAMAMGMIPTYDSGMALIELLRDPSPMVRASAAESAAAIHAKHCEEYVKKLAFSDDDPNVRQIARRAFDKLRDSVV